MKENVLVERSSEKCPECGKPTDGDDLGEHYGASAQCVCSLTPAEPLPATRSSTPAAETMRFDEDSLRDLLNGRNRAVILDVPGLGLKEMWIDNMELSSSVSHFEMVLYLEFRSTDGFRVSCAVVPGRGRRPFDWKIQRDVKRDWESEWSYVPLTGLKQPY